MGSCVSYGWGGLLCSLLTALMRSLERKAGSHNMNALGGGEETIL